MSGRVDWEALMRVGLGGLRMTPETFWTLSPREFSAAVAGAFGGGQARRGGAMPSARLRELMDAYPDGAEGTAR